LRESPRAGRRWRRHEVQPYSAQPSASNGRRDARRIALRRQQPHEPPSQHATAQRRPRWRASSRSPLPTFPPITRRVQPRSLLVLLDRVGKRGPLRTEARSCHDNDRRELDRDRVATAARASRAEQVERSTTCRGRRIASAATAQPKTSTSARAGPVTAARGAARWQHHEARSTTVEAPSCEQAPPCPPPPLGRDHDERHRERRPSAAFAATLDVRAGALVHSNCGRPSSRFVRTKAEYSQSTAGSRREDQSESGQAKTSARPAGNRRRPRRPSPSPPRDPIEPRRVLVVVVESGRRAIPTRPARGCSRGSPPSSSVAAIHRLGLSCACRAAASAAQPFARMSRNGYAAPVVTRRLR